MSQHTLTREQVRQVDRLAIEQYGMSGLVLMENAGRAATDMLQKLDVGERFVICCGKGNNAGDGFVIARHLDLRGLLARVLMWSPPDQIQGDAAVNYQILCKTDVPIHVLDDDFDKTDFQEQLEQADCIVDALLGTGAKGQPRSPFDRVIAQMNASSGCKVAIDIPSGLDCDTGQPAVPTFVADHTLTFVAAKPGFFTAPAQQYVGLIHVLDIGAPRKLIEEVSRDASGSSASGC